MQIQFSKFYVFYFFALFFKVTLWTNIAFLPQIWDQIKQQFFLNYFFLFSIQSSQLSRNMCKLCVKLRNATIYPPWVWFFQNFFSSKMYSSPIWNARLAPKVTFEPYQWEESGIFLIRGLKSHNFEYTLPTLVDALIFQENGLAITFTWQNKP